MTLSTLSCIHYLVFLSCATISHSASDQAALGHNNNLFSRSLRNLDEDHEDDVIWNDSNRGVFREQQNGGEMVMVKQRISPDHLKRRAINTCNYEKFPDNVKTDYTKYNDIIRNNDEESLEEYQNIPDTDDIISELNRIFTNRRENIFLSDVYNTQDEHIKKLKLNNQQSNKNEIENMHDGFTKEVNERSIKRNKWIKETKEIDDSHVVIDNRYQGDEITISNHYDFNANESSGCDSIYSIFSKLAFPDSLENMICKSQDQSISEYDDTLDYDKLIEFCNEFQEQYKENIVWSDYDEAFSDFSERIKLSQTDGDFLFPPLEKNDNQSSWVHFNHEISRLAIYNPNSPTVNKVLQDLATQPVTKTETFDHGTQIKLFLTFKDGARAIFKPMRFSRETETLPDHFYFNDFERHNAEIAAFHIDRLLGFYRVPPTVGRLFSISDDFNDFVNTTFEENVYISPAQNTCFYTNCEMYCDSNHPICGNPDTIEASLSVFLPGEPEGVKREYEEHPWIRSYSTNWLTSWQHDEEYCSKVRKEELYSSGRRLLDVIDVAVFDFLIGNMDRHDVDIYLKFGKNSSPILFDNGRAFGKSDHDEMSILTPINQCCQVRLSTIAKLIKLHTGKENLSLLMKESLTQDPLDPILTEPHLDALDRRISIILNEIRNCLHKKQWVWKKVIIQDDIM